MFNQNKMERLANNFIESDLEFEIDEDFEFEMGLSLHIDEFNARFALCFGFCVFVTSLCLGNMEYIVHLLQAPASGVKFMQLGPGEYFVTSIKVGLSVGLLTTSPLILMQLFIYFLPGLTKNEISLVRPILVGSTILFNVGLIFSYLFLLPAALQFFIAYGSNVVEPIWSFEQYFDFVSVLLFTSGLAFQIPVVQVVLGILGVVSSQKMFGGWKYAVLACVMISAILTPSTDPITQILMTAALLALYFGGSLIVLIIEKAR